MSIAPLTPVLTALWDTQRSWKLDTYRSNGGYFGALLALKLAPIQVIAEVKASGLRGRGGAGFPTGVKWGFVPNTPETAGQPKYLVVNCDESEPGTCKDMPLLMANPHLVVEGAIIAAYAIGAHQVFIYIRGEVIHAVRRMQQAVAEAYQAGLLGAEPLGVPYPLHVTVHAGAGAYICGEETALLDSLEGRPGRPRSRPPFPAVAGLYGQPTLVNNAETIASLPAILVRGAAWHAQFGTEQSKGTTIYSVSGHVRFPGQFEAPFGITARTLLEFAGGIREGHKLKFFTPGGSSTPLFTEDQLDVPLSYEAVAEAGSQLGTKALQFFDETTSVLRTTRRWMEFYAAESCGKCSPCREGSQWLRQLVVRLEEGHGQPGDVELISDICNNVSGKTFCPLADGFVAMMTSAIRHFPSEFEAGYRRPASELFPYERSAVFPIPAPDAEPTPASRRVTRGEGVK
ncbi:MAG: NADH-quinone oxidoreductase subunit NuoF [Propionibacteriaceae bacterium]|nr:NADH-quinone oxidoreductase subunit NuoF [Propionibacteriaceae bacterium]